MGFSTPTPIQGIAIPPLMQGRDVLAAAATGSGKTAAFVLPILHRLADRPRGTTRALVLAPTRELAAQICDHLTSLARHTRMSGAAVFGGVKMQPQVDAFRRGVDVIVATPGRLLDHFQHDYARLDRLEVLVLDEADRMLDMGFLPDVKRVLSHLPKDRQTLLFSATLPPPIVSLSREVLRAPVALNVERKSAPAKGITHFVYPVPHDDLKPELLADLLARTQYDSVLAFTRTKHRANRLADLLERRGLPCTRIHGNRSQTRRTEALDGFKDGAFRVMVATDIAARGIDVEGLALVVNVDVPHVPEDYIHRVGRTARADLTGVAITLVCPDEEEDLRHIERHMGRRIPRERLEGFDPARRPAERFEVPIRERIAEIRARKAAERERSREKAERKAAAEADRARATAEREQARAARGPGRAASPRFDSPRPPAQPGRHPRDGQRSRFDAPRPRYDAPRPRYDAPRPPRQDAPAARMDERRPDTRARPQPQPQARPQPQSQPQPQFQPRPDPSLPNRWRSDAARTPEIGFSRDDVPREPGAERAPSGRRFGRRFR
ncbi:MAG: DEAD/DEAH box helicase [Deltaproteobacteria bacterium]|nr:DEAD/DEAH box helicase [Deltaproteobacteria bacterium]